jgi:hypothetical protein
MANPYATDPNQRLFDQPDIPVYDYSKSDALHARQYSAASQQLNQSIADRRDRETAEVRALIEAPRALTAEMTSAHEASLDQDIANYHALVADRNRGKKYFQKKHPGVDFVREVEGYQSKFNNSNKKSQELVEGVNLLTEKAKSGLFTNLSINEARRFLQSEEAMSDLDAAGKIDSILTKGYKTTEGVKKVGGSWGSTKHSINTLTPDGTRIKKEHDVPNYVDSWNDETGEVKVELDAKELQRIKDDFPQYYQGVEAKYMAEYTGYGDDTNHPQAPNPDQEIKTHIERELAAQAKLDFGYVKEEANALEDQVKRAKIAESKARKKKLEEVDEEEEPEDTEFHQRTQNDVLSQAAKGNFAPLRSILGAREIDPETYAAKQKKIINSKGDTYDDAEKEDARLNLRDYNEMSLDKGGKFFRGKDGKLFTNSWEGITTAYSRHMQGTAKANIDGQPFLREASAAGGTILMNDPNDYITLSRKGQFLTPHSEADVADNKKLLGQYVRNIENWDYDFEAKKWVEGSQEQEQEQESQTYELPETPEAVKAIEQDNPDAYNSLVAFMTEHEITNWKEGHKQWKAEGKAQQ